MAAQGEGVVSFLDKASGEGFAEQKVVEQDPEGWRGIIRQSGIGHSRKKHSLGLLIILTKCFRFGQGAN